MVVTIVSMLATLGMLAFSQVQKAGTVSMAEESLAQAIHQARFEALANSQMVAFCFYKYAKVGEAQSAFRAVQAYRWIPQSPEGAAGWRAVSRPFVFPTDIAMGENSMQATLPQTLPEVNAQNGPPIPSSLAASGPVEARQLTFFPDGTADLDPDKNWYVTLYAQSASVKDSASGLPANWRSIQIDPVLGTTKIYAP